MRLKLKKHPRATTNKYRMNDWTNWRTLPFNIQLLVFTERIIQIRALCLPLLLLILFYISFYLLYTVRWCYGAMVVCSLCVPFISPFALLISSFPIWISFFVSLSLSLIVLTQFLALSLGSDSFALVGSFSRFWFWLMMSVRQCCCCLYAS